jgi:uncharacterized protein YjbI with pentapeptide repeats
MADEEQLTILLRGVHTWNQWRLNNLRMQVNLRDANLHRADLSGANLATAVLTDANLEGADLSGADLCGAHLEANLVSADLKRSNLSGANLRHANLSWAKLSMANLLNTDLTNADVAQADFTEARVGWTSFVGVDLSTARGLAMARHEAPSIIDVDALCRSRGKIPEPFLRGAGIPETFITQIGVLTGLSGDFSSCFISFAAEDRRFAECLHADLRREQIRCWLAGEDVTRGAAPDFGQSIQRFDKVIVVVSRASLQLSWMEEAVAAGVARTKEQLSPVLFFICIDDALIHTTKSWAANISQMRHIIACRDWTDRTAYATALAQLLRSLKGEDSEIL